MKIVLRISTFLLLFMLIISCGSAKKSTVVNNNTTNKSASKIELAGGDGTAMDKAIIILNAKGSSDGIPAEYDYLKKAYGRRGVDWIFIQQALVHKNNKSYDVLTINIPPSKENVDVYFDITAFFGKY